MRVDLKKYLFVGTEASRHAFFTKAQELGVIDFIDANPEKHQEAPPEIQHVTHAIKVLRSLPTVKQEELGDYELANGITTKILEYKHTLDNLLERQRVLKLEIARVEIFGNFSPKDVSYIESEGHKAIQFFCTKKIPEKDGDEREIPQEMIFIGSDHGLDYFVTVNDEPRQYDKMIEMKIDTPVGELEKQLKRVESEIDETEEHLKTYAKYNSFLHHALIFKLNHYNLSKAQDYVQEEIDGALFAVQGWVPKTKIAELDDLVKEYDVYYDEVAIEERDRVPTCLENTGASRMGEDLINIYDTPSIEDRDPSPWVLVFFSLFFAFIVGDGGYGFIFLTVALFLRYKLRDVKKTGKRVINLFTILAVSCIIWGFLTTSFFGISFGPDSPLQKVSVAHWLVMKKAEYHLEQKGATFQEWAKQYPDIKNSKSADELIEKASIVRDGEKSFEMYNSFYDGVMLELALLVGIIHIILSLARYLDKNWAAFGWIIFIIGGYLYFPFYLGTASMLHYVFGFNEATVGPDGIAFLAGGLGLALTLSIIQNKLFGLLEVTALVQIFGDILSYLRLYALGLAGGIVSATVNELADSVIFAAGILIILIGHSVNILLSVMGGIIHGLRLNFIEWYHYCFEGGGKMYNPLRKLEVD